MMRPGRIFINTEVRLTANFHDDAGNDTDPTSVSMYLISPSGTKTLYTYLSDDNVGRADTGDYYCDVTPDRSGRWFWRWQAVGAGTTVANEGDFLVQYSEFESPAAVWGDTTTTDANWSQTDW